MRVMGQSIMSTNRLRGDLEMKESTYLKRKSRELKGVRTREGFISFYSFPRLVSGIQ